MENEATNTIQERLVNNPHLAATLRRNLLQAKGRLNLRYEAEDTFVFILSCLTDSQLVEKYIAHGVRTRILLDAPVNPCITSVRAL